MVSVCNATYRLLGVNGKIGNFEVGELINTHLGQDSRITITGLLGFCIKVPEVKAYLRTIGRPVEEIKELDVINTSASDVKFSRLLGKP